MPFPLSRRWRAAARACRRRRRIAPIISAKRRDIARLEKEASDLKTEADAARKEAEAHLTDPTAELDCDCPVRAAVLAGRSKRLEVSAGWYDKELNKNKAQLKELDDLLAAPEEEFGQLVEQEKAQDETEGETSDDPEKKKCSWCCCGSSRKRSVTDEEEGEDDSPEHKLKVAEGRVKKPERTLIENEAEMHRLDGLIKRAKAKGDENEADENCHKKEVVKRVLEDAEGEFEQNEKNLRETQESVFQKMSERCADDFKKSLRLIYYPSRVRAYSRPTQAP